MLRVVDAHRRRVRCHGAAVGRQGDLSRVSGGVRRELDETPRIGEVHVHLALVPPLARLPHHLRLPHPVDLPLPLDARKVDPPRAPHRRLHRPWLARERVAVAEGDLDGPGGAFRRVEPASQDASCRGLPPRLVVLARARPGNSARVLSSAVRIGPCEQQVPHRVERVDLELLVRVARPLCIDKHLKVAVLLEDGRVALCKRGPNLKVRGELRADVEVLAVPKHLHPRDAGRGRLRAVRRIGASDLLERRRPRRSRPGRFGEVAVDDERRCAGRQPRRDIEQRVWLHVRAASGQGATQLLSISRGPLAG
mmetsp:Transcript_10351/g.32772  ORF Transcript_10351/g.32772 Transcript_10351/m.32772 type:complete len:309 (+) Transcript_10351:249-1175(+)